MTNNKSGANKRVTQRFKDYQQAWLVSLLFVIGLFMSDYAGAQTQTGKASFYSKRATGARTANGERLHHDSLTCAHRSLPFGTILKVTNLVNNKQVLVRVNDRGPFRKGRIIDLSWGAAKAIGMLSQGIVPVTVERMHETVIPFKPEEDEGGIAKFEFELADIAPTGIIPVWQQEVEIDHQAVKRSMRRTAQKSEQEIRSTMQQSSVKQQDNKQAAEHLKSQPSSADVLDEINQKPNASKAYMKRNQSKH